MEREELGAQERARVLDDGLELVLLHQAAGAERRRPRLVHRGTPQIGRDENNAAVLECRRIQRVIWLLAACAVAPERKKKRRMCRLPKMC